MVTTAPRPSWSHVAMSWSHVIVAWSHVSPNPPVSDTVHSVSSRNWFVRLVMASATSESENWSVPFQIFPVGGDSSKCNAHVVDIGIEHVVRALRDQLWQVVEWDGWSKLECSPSAIEPTQAGECADSLSEIDGEFGETPVQIVRVIKQRRELRDCLHLRDVGVRHSRPYRSPFFSGLL